MHSLELVKLACNEDEKALFAEMTADVIEAAKTGPVIVFGVFDPKEVLAKVEKIKTYTVKTVDELKMVQKAVADKKFGVIHLHPQFKVGADLKFQTDAKVFIYTPRTKLDREQVTQMLGRG